MKKGLAKCIFFSLAFAFSGQGATAQQNQQSVQIEQLQTAKSDQGSIEDKLFILWEYSGALRERRLAEAVLKKTKDEQIASLARLVRDGHTAGMEAMQPAAAELGLKLPTEATPLEIAAIELAGSLPAEKFELFFLRRQLSMHAWDITTFNYYASAATNETLKKYVDATRAPLREHALLVARLAHLRGIKSELVTLEKPEH